MTSAPTLLFVASIVAITRATLVAQTNPCDPNYYPIRFVDAQGVAAPVSNEPTPVASFATEQVYMSFANLPDGNYDLYVHVTDRLDGINDEVLSINDPADRFVTVVKTNGIVDLSLPASNNQNPDVIVTLADGNEILLITPVRNSVTEPCLFKAWFGISPYLGFGPDWPYIVRVSNNTSCTLSSFAYFRIGDSIPGSDVTGSAFEDLDRDCVRDPGEAPLIGWEVRLVSESAALGTTYTGPNGEYAFANVGAGNYTVEIIIPPGYVAGTTSAYAVELCGCADLDLGEFCASSMTQDCNACTVGFWRNKHGVELVQQFGILATLPALCLADESGPTGTTPPATIEEWRAFLKSAESTNMSYMLSAQLAAMHSNVLAGLVGLDCVIVDPVLGNLTIRDLMLRAVNELCNDGYTPAGDPNRHAQMVLKDALDNANNNRNWL